MKRGAVPPWRMVTISFYLLRFAVCCLRCASCLLLQQGACLEGDSSAYLVIRNPMYELLFGGAPQTCHSSTSSVLLAS
jgi:hypothetical protein